MQWELIKLRKKFNITQKEMAQHLGISETTYVNKETGKTQFKMEEMFFLSNFFDEKIENIFLSNKFTVRDEANV